MQSCMTDSEQTVQHEHAPMLVTFGDLADRVTTLLRARPELLSRLAFAPRRAIHAIAAYLYLSPAAFQTDAQTAANIVEVAPRELLRAAMPESPPTLYRALDRAGDRVLGRSLYEMLRSVAAGPFGARLLESGPLDEYRVKAYASLVDMDPLMLKLHAALPEDSNIVGCVNSLLGLLRSHDALVESDFDLPQRAGVAAVMRRLQRRIDEIGAPSPEFTPPPPFRLISSVGELRRIGTQFGNCLNGYRWQSAKYWCQLIDGSMAYLISDEPPVVAALQQVGKNLWMLNQVCGPKNSAVPPGVQSALIRGLRADGVRMVSVEPYSALSSLDERARRRNRDNDEDDDEGDWQAA